MKKIYVLFTIVLGVCLISCGSTPAAEKAEPETPIVEETTVEVPEDDVQDIDDEVELVNEEVEQEEDEAEYLRSTQALSAEELVTKDEFAEELNRPLMLKEADAPLVEYIKDAYRSLEIAPPIKIMGFEYSESESGVDVNRFIFKREKRKKKKLAKQQ